MKPSYARACEFLKAILCDFAKIDVEIHPIFAKIMNFPPFEHAPFITKGIQYLSLRATSFPDLGIFKISRDSEKFFIPAIAFHR